MRLVALLLSATALAAQKVPPLPWEAEGALAWQASSPEKPEVVPTPSRPAGSLRVRLTPDGSLHLLDAQGIVRLRLGLPGRPLRAWRDAGVPLSLQAAEHLFPEETPLKQGLKSLPIGEADFRPGLEGLLWILEDGERYLTVLHPATCQILHLPLPAGQRFALFWKKDRLELRQEGETGELACWSMPYLSLLPQLLRLATPVPAPPPGGALRPFPKE